MSLYNSELQYGSSEFNESYNFSHLSLFMNFKKIYTDPKLLNGQLHTTNYKIAAVLVLFLISDLKIATVPLRFLNADDLQ